MSKDGESVSVQVSIGMTENASGTITTFKDLFHFADSALYHAKRRGKNQIYIN